MNNRTALSLQTEEQLDLAEMAEACVSVGLVAGASARGILVGIPGKRKRCRWKGTLEHGYLLVLLRDAVRGQAPGSFAFPWEHEEDGRCVVYVRNRKGHDLRPAEGYPHIVPCFGQTETECWARALVALYRARLLGGGA